MEELNGRIHDYFQTRTKGKGGVIKDYLATPQTRHSIFLGGNDYLNLVNNEEVVRCQVEDLQHGAGRGVVMSSAFLTDEDPHFQLEKDLGDWYGKECQLAQSGYAANVGLIHAICKPGMNVYIDMFLHMSFYDGFAARRVKVHSNKPNNVSELEANIQKHGPGLIIIESVYSINGAFAPLEEVVRIKKQYGCVLIVDESHSFGLYGSKGYVHMKGLEDDVEFVTASLSKAFATRAGIVFGSNAAFLKENSFAYVFSSALMRNDIIRIRAMWEVIKTADDRREKLFKASVLLRNEVSKVTKVVKVPGSLPPAIISLPVKDEEQMAALHRHLSSRGILAAPFAYPATAPNHPIIRFTCHSDITPEDVFMVTSALSEFFGVKPKIVEASKLVRKRSMTC
jgi:CAI-1 autoinducer synthase